MDGRKRARGLIGSVRKREASKGEGEVVRVEGPMRLGDNIGALATAPVAKSLAPNKEADS